MPDLRSAMRMVVWVFQAFAVAYPLGYAWYGLVGYVVSKVGITQSPATIALQYIGFVATAAGAIYVLAKIVREQAELRKRRLASERVDEEIARIHAMPGTDVAAISTKAVVDSLKGTGVSDDHLERLVEHSKQKALINDEYFSKEVRELIVDYLQPLPRNAKRVLNRFRVNLLIADKRGLFASEPKVTVQQIGKWLVLGERWPQLARALSAAPERVDDLELQARQPAPPAPSAPPPGLQLAAAPVDPFMESIKVLAPYYVGDEDLRKFMVSKPPISTVLPRLVHYGSTPAAAAANVAP